MNSINSPPPLRRNFGGSIIEILIFSFEETKINFVELVIEDLLREFVAVERGIRGEKNPVLVLVEKFSGGYRLSPQLANPGSHIDEHVREPVQVLGNILQIFRKIAEVQGDKLRLRVACHHAIAGFNQFGIAWEIASIKRPVRMIVQLFIPLVKTIGRSKKGYRV